MSLISQNSGPDYERAVSRHVTLYLATALIIFLFGGALGFLMRLNQSQILSFGDATFYSLLTLHGMSMVAWLTVASVGLGWFAEVKLLGRHIPLNRISLVYWLLFVGWALMLVSTLVGRFSAAYTFLYPLPFFSYGVWQPWAVATFFAALLLFEVGAFVFVTDWLVGCRKTVGGIGKALGLEILASGDSSHNPSSTTPAVIVLTAFSLVGAYTLLVGIYHVGMGIAKLIDPGVFIDALVAKSTLFIFAHTLVNILMWVGLALVYLLVPVYTGREWKASRALVVAWLITTLTTGLTVYPHHLYMDFAQPSQLSMFGETASYISVIPPAAVTILGALTRIWRSGMQWKPAIMFAYAGMFGFMIGGSAALADATIGTNKVFHNTLWVPAHFHSYMLLGVSLFIFAAFYHFLPTLIGKSSPNSKLPLVHFWMTNIGGWGFLSMFYLSGLLGTPRRYAEYTVAGMPNILGTYTLVSVYFIDVLAIGQLVFFYYVYRLLRQPRQ